MSGASRKRSRLEQRQKGPGGHLEEKTIEDSLPEPSRTRRRIGGVRAPSPLVRAFATPSLPEPRASEVCDNRRRFDIDRFHKLLISSRTHARSRSASRENTIRPTLQMISSLFKPANLKTAFLHPRAVASRSNVISLDIKLVTDFAKLTRDASLQKPHVLRHAADCALSFCEEQLSSCKIRTNHKAQAVFALMFHPCIGLPSSVMRTVTNAIARVAVQKLALDKQSCLLGWIVQLPRPVLLRLVRSWIDHIEFSWLSQNSAEERQVHPRGPLNALHWVRLLHWACRVRERDVPRSIRSEGSYLLEHDFNSPVISRQLNPTRFVNILYFADEHMVPPGSAFLNHSYLFDAPAKAQIVKYEAKKLWRPRTRELRTENKLIARHISSMSHHPRLLLQVHRENTLREAMDWLSSVSAVEKTQMAFAREAALNSIRLRDLPQSILSENDTKEDQDRKLEEFKRAIDEEMKREFIQFHDICYEVPLEIRFAHERGVDEGGLTRHFFELIAQQSCSGPNPLFVRRSDRAPCVWFPGFKSEEEYIVSSGMSYSDGPSLDRYESFGLLLGLAIKTRSRIGMKLPLIVFEYLLHRKNSPPCAESRFSDWNSIADTHKNNIPSKHVDKQAPRAARRVLASRAAITKRSYSWIPKAKDGIPFALRKAASEIDPDLLKGVDALLEYDDSGDENAVRDLFCLDHSVSLKHGRSDSRSESTKAVSLVPYLPRSHGQLHPSHIIEMETPVTGKNRHQYAYALFNFHVRGAHLKRLNAMRVGFRRITKMYLSLHTCTSSELRLLLCGEAQINVNNILSSARFVGYNRHSNAIVWLFQILSDFSQDDLRQFYLFVTGSSTAPCGGINENPITIQRNTSENNRFPSSHTCFNQLLLPEYSSKAIMRDRVLFSISSCKDFGLL